MPIFAEEVMPVITHECGGKVELPARGLDLVPQGRLTPERTYLWHDWMEPRRS